MPLRQAPCTDGPQFLHPGTVPMHTGNGFTGGRVADRRREAGERGAGQVEEHDLIAWAETTPSCSDAATVSRSRCGSKTSQATSAFSASSPPRHSPGPSRSRRCAIGIRLRQPWPGRVSGEIRSSEADGIAGNRALVYPGTVSATGSTRR